MKKQIFFSLLGLLCLVPLPGYAYDFYAGGLYYNITSTTAPYTVEVTKRGNGYYYQETTINIPSSVTYNGTSYSVTSIGDWAFSYCSKLTAITIPSSVTKIGAQAFAQTGISSITIPVNVTYVGNKICDGCTALRTIVWNAKSSTATTPFYSVRSQITTFTFGEEVETIPADLCSGMTALTGITLPGSVRRIESQAFFGCTALASITCNATAAPACGEFAFYRVPTTIPVHIPCGSLSSYKGKSGWSSFKNLTEPYFYAFELQTADAAMGTVKFDQPFTCASKVAYFSAVPATGYHFTQWSDGNTDNPRTLTLTKDMTLTAEFAINQYTLTVLSDNEEQGTATGSTTADYNTTVEISATAETGYHFVQWSDGNTDNPRTVTVTADATYTAQFAPNRYTLTVLSADEEQGTVAGGTTADYNTTVEISATAATGYHFLQWSDGNTDNPRTVTVTADATYTAQFAPNQYTLTVLSDNEEQGTVAGGTTADYLTEIVITAVPAAGYTFLQWNDDNTDNPRTVTLTEDATYTAFFMKDEATGIGQTTDTPAAQKIIRNGQVRVRRGDKTYTLTGQEIQ